MAFDPTQPFLRADGLEHGLGEKAMRGPGYRRLFRNVLVASTTPPTACSA